MTYKQPDGLDPRRYKKRTSVHISRSFVRRNEGEQFILRERRTALAHPRSTRKAFAEKEAVAASTRARGSALHAGRSNTSAQGVRPGQRKVTMPHEAVQPLTWAERHARSHNQSELRPMQNRLVPRTFAQTGRPASIGQTRARRALPEQHANQRVPARSGKLRGNGSLWRRLLGWFSVLAVLSGGLIFALVSPIFHIQQVEISGTQNQALISKIQRIGIQGQDIFLFSQSGLVAHLEAMPQVAAASLDVQLPHTLVVVVQERAPVLLWQVGKTTYGLAQDGTVIAPQNELSGTEHLAVVLDSRRATSKVQPGSHFNAADIVFIEQVFEQIPGIEGVSPFSLQYVDSITQGSHTYPANVAGSGSYVIVSANGWRAYLGDSQNGNSLANRLQELQQILNIARQQNMQIATIDLRFGTRPTYTLKP